MKEHMVRFCSYVQVVSVLLLVSCSEGKAIPALHFDNSKLTISSEACRLAEILRGRAIFTNRLFDSRAEVVDFLRTFGSFNLKILESLVNADSNYNNVILRNDNYEIHVGYWKYHKQFTVDYIGFLNFDQKMFDGVALGQDLVSFERRFGKVDINSYDGHLRHYYSADHQTVSIHLDELDRLKSLSLSTFFIDD